MVSLSSESHITLQQYRELGEERCKCTINPQPFGQWVTRAGLALLVDMVEVVP